MTIDERKRSVVPSPRRSNRLAPAPTYAKLLAFALLPVETESSCLADPQRVTPARFSSFPDSDVMGVGDSKSLRLMCVPVTTTSSSLVATQNRVRVIYLLLRRRRIRRCSLIH